VREEPVNEYGAARGSGSSDPGLIGQLAASACNACPKREHRPYVRARDNRTRVDVGRPRSRRTRWGARVSDTGEASSGGGRRLLQEQRNAAAVLDPRAAVATGAVLRGERTECYAPPQL